MYWCRQFNDACSANTLSVKVCIHTCTGSERRGVPQVYSTSFPNVGNSQTYQKPERQNRCGRLFINIERGDGMRSIPRRVHYGRSPAGRLPAGGGRWVHAVLVHSTSAARCTGAREQQHGRTAATGWRRPCVRRAHCAALAVTSRSFDSCRQPSRAAPPVFCGRADRYTLMQPQLGCLHQTFILYSYSILLVN